MISARLRYLLDRHRYRALYRHRYGASPPWKVHDDLVFREGALLEFRRARRDQRSIEIWLRVHIQYTRENGSPGPWYSRPTRK